MTSFTQPLMWTHPWFRLSLSSFWRILSHSLTTNSPVALTFLLSRCPLSKLTIILSPETNSFSFDSSAFSLIHHVCHFRHSKIPFFLLTICFPVIPTLKSANFVLSPFFSPPFVSLTPTLPSDQCSQITSSGLTLTRKSVSSLCLMLSHWPELFLHSTCQSF